MGKSCEKAHKEKEGRSTGEKSRSQEWEGKMEGALHTVGRPSSRHEKERVVIVYV